MARVGTSGYTIAKSTLNLKVKNAPPPYAKPSHSIKHKGTVVYGNSLAWEAFRKWLASHPAGGVAIARGPSGVGKTHTVKLIATNLLYAVTEFNASSCDTAAQLKARLHEASLGDRLNGHRRLILVDEFDGLPAELQDAVLSHARSMTSRSAPLVCTCGNFASATVRAVAGLAQQSIDVWPVPPTELVKYAAKYYPTRHPDSVQAAIRSANGDIRQFDMRLRVPDATKPDPVRDIFKLGHALVTCRSPARWLDDSLNADAAMSLYLAHENYLSAAPSLEAMADAADLYSTAECMRSCRAIGAMDGVVSALSASGPCVSARERSAIGAMDGRVSARSAPSVSTRKWAMQPDAKIRWPELLRARTPNAGGDTKSAGDARRAAT